MDAEAAGELEVLAATQMGIEVRFFGDVAEATLEALEVAADVLAMKEDASAGGFEEAGEHLDGGAFAGSVGAEIAQDLTGADGEADAIHGGWSYERFAEIEGFEHVK